jgi:hypothetical protein
MIEKQAGVTIVFYTAVQTLRNNYFCHRRFSFTALSHSSKGIV